MPHHFPLPLSVRANLYTQLAAMETAGLPFFKTLDLIRLPGMGQTRLVTMRKLVARGIAIHVAGEKSGLFTKLESTLIRAASEAGSPASTFKRLASTYTRRDTQRKKIRSRMMLPAVTLIAALFIQPLPMLVGGSISMGGYLLNAFGPLLALFVAFIVARRLPHAIHNSAVQSHVDRMLPNIYLIGPYLVRRSLGDFFETLALMLEAGIPIVDALPRAVETIQNSMVRGPYENLESLIRDGATFTQALSCMPYLEDGRAIAFIQTGEQSGTLPEMLFRHAAGETEAIDRFEQQAAEWLPRIVYALVVCWIAYGIVLGQSFGPRLPLEVV